MLTYSRGSSSGAFLQLLTPWQTEALSCRKLTDRHLVDQTKGSVLLDMPGMEGNPRNLEAWIFRYFYRIQFSGIKSSLNSFQGTSNRLFDSGCCRPADPGAGANTHQRHEMPTGISNPLIQDGGCRIFDGHPRLTKLLLD